MSITTTTTDDLMNSYASLINETTATTLPHNPELQLSINDLVHPTEKAETLLETLSSEQLNIIEQTLFKIKERKLGTPPSTIITGNLLSPNTVAAVQDIPSSTITTTTTTIISNDMSNITTSSESQDWDSTATRVAKALANAISMSSNNNSNNNENQQGQDPPVNKTTANIIKNSIGSSNNATMVQTHDNKNNSNNNKPQQQQAPFLSSSSHEPTTELREGVEWVSFVYSHHRTLRRYCIRTDLDKVDTSILDDKFKKENCVYPRANLPRESYRGNRWAYETECNVLGWKLAYLNMEEIAGKRGLIQRAVDSYRNRYPSMRSRRVARQEKLLKGTLRKRKHNNNNCSNNENDSKSTSPSSFKQQQQNIQVPDHLYLERQTPKTILIEDGCSNNNSSSSKCRIRINIESVVLDAIDIAFRKNNCVFPRSMNITAETPCVTQRRLDEAKCNEIGWKLAWLNPRQLANKKNLLQRALDTYRSQFTTDLKPRKYASRVPPAPFSLTQELNPSCLKDEEDVNMEEATIQYQQLATTTTNNDSNSNNNNNNNNNEMTDVEMTTTDNNLKLEEGEQVVDKRLDMLQDSTTTNSKTIPLTEQALADQQREFMELDLANNNNNYTGIERRNSVAAQSCYSGTTVTLDFHDYCFSPPPEDDDDDDLDGDDEMGSFELNHSSNNNDISTTCNSPTHFTSSVMFDAVLLGSLGNDQQHIIVLQKDEDDCCHLSSSDTSHQNSPSPNNNNSASSSSSSSLSSTTEIGGGGCQVESLSMLSLNEMYQQALLLDPTSTNTLFNTTTTTTTSGQLVKEDHLFETGFGDSNELLTKYENVNAGMDDFTGPLLSQLF